MHRKTMFLLAVILFMIVCVVAGQFTPSGSKEGKDPRFVFAEKYRPQQSDYKYGFVDTNPARRVGAFFDNCSPENMGDCKRNDPYKGLPKP